MATTNSTMTLVGNVKDRSQALTAVIAIALAAATILLAAWVGLRFVGAPAPVAEGNPFAHEMLRQHLLRENGAAPAVTAPDWFQRHELAPAAAAPADLFRQHLLRENGAAPAAAPYADYGQRQRLVPAGTGYEDFGQRHRPGGR